MRFRSIPFSAAVLTVAAFAMCGGSGLAQDSGKPSHEALLSVPVTSQRIAGTDATKDIKPPVGMDDPEAVQLGMQYFNQFNCSGCHAANGAGGMGPSLSNRKFVYGGDPANIFLTIQQGRPNGMPAWGELLTHDVIWRIVAYVRSISNAPQTGWGKTTSPAGFTIEQVPAQRINTPTPWEHTQAFSYGQPPFREIQGQPPRPTSEKSADTNDANAPQPAQQDK
jgi:cytochrome c oxidase cbb3-type subunit 3